MIKSNRYRESIEHCLLQAQFVDMNFDPNKLKLSKTNENQKKFRFKNSKKTPKVQIVVRIIEKIHARQCNVLFETSNYGTIS